MASSYKDLIAWQKAIRLTLAVYTLTRSFPREELYGLTSQTRRAAVSVAANIAEGQGRLSPRDFRKFLGQARGSVFELETHLLIARSLNYVTEVQAREVLRLLEDVARLVNALQSSIKARADEATASD